MKIKTTITEIECNAEELRQSNTVSDGLINAMRRAFNGPIFNTTASHTDLEGQRVWFYDTIAESIEPDPSGKTLELNWSPKHGTWQIDKYKTGYPSFAHFGKYEHYPYLD